MSKDINRKGYNYIVRLAREVETYILSAPVGRGLTTFFCVNKIEEGSDKAFHAISVAKALGYSIKRRKGVYYEHGDKIEYYVQDV